MMKEEEYIKAVGFLYGSFKRFMREIKGECGKEVSFKIVAGYHNSSRLANAMVLERKLNIGEFNSVFDELVELTALLEAENKDMTSVIDNLELIRENLIITV